MPLYLFQGSYSTDAIKAMVEKPQDREAAARPLIEALGGKLVNLYFCFGSDDVVAILDMPDDTAMAAGALAIGGSGAFSGGATTKLFTSSDAQAAMAAANKVVGKYRPATG